MSREYELPAEILGRRVKGLQEDIDGINRQINPMIARRDGLAIDLRILENAIEVLRERDGTGTPEVDYSPADGEQPPAQTSENKRPFRATDHVRINGRTAGGFAGQMGVVAEDQSGMGGSVRVQIRGQARSLSFGHHDLELYLDDDLTPIKVGSRYRFRRSGSNWGGMLVEVKALTRKGITVASEAYEGAYLDDVRPSELA